MSQIFHPRDLLTAAVAGRIAALRPVLGGTTAGFVKGISGSLWNKDYFNRATQTGGIYRDEGRDGRTKLDFAT